MSEAVERYKQLADRSIQGTKWIICGDVAAAFTASIKGLSEIGVPRPLLLAGSTGTGDLPTEEEAELVLLGTSAESMMLGIRAYNDALRELPAEVIARIDAWDPDREARVLPSFLDTITEIAGRPAYAPRPEHWLDLENKTTVHELYEGAGIEYVPGEVVDATRAPLVAAAERADRGSGTVWAADNKEGWHGGAEYTRYVADHRSADTTIEFMEGHADEVRVMPFLEGVPCSIHGMVFADAVATFRPVEMVTFRKPDSDRLRYSSAATTWDPPAAVRDEMRAAARRMGDHLQDRVEFRGAFTMDGVATAEGFRPSEVNTRFGAGLGAVAQASGLPLLGLSRMVIAGDDDEIDPAELEEIVVSAADAQRRLAGMAMVPKSIPDTTERRLDWDGDGFQLLDAEEGGKAMLSIGPAPMGGMVRLVFDAEHTPSGVQAAPIVAKALELADETWDTGIGELIPATPAH